jgi:hypothetical protein
MGENRRRRRTNIIHATRRAARQVNCSVPHRDSPAHLGVDRSFAGRIKRVIYPHAIKKDGRYVHATKSFVGTCVPCTQLLFTHMPFRP